MASMRGLILWFRLSLEIHGAGHHHTVYDDRSLSTQKDIQPSILSFDTREGSADKR